MTSETTPTKDSFANCVWDTLKQWDSIDQESHTFSTLYLYRDIQRAEALTPRQATNKVLRSGIQMLAETYEQDAQLLEARFMDNDSIHKLSNRFNIAESTVYTRQREAIEKLATVLNHQEAQASAEHKARQQQRLEAATYQQLVGIEPLREKIMAQLTASGDPWLISIEGIGGLGKTSLAHLIMTDVIERGLYADIGWVSAKHQHLNLAGTIDSVAVPALTAVSLVEQLVEQLLPEYRAAELSVKQQLQMLQKRLNDEAYLIVIDNLETLVDVEELLPTLQKLANPSRFILTSRQSIKSQISVFPHSVPPLGEADALTLVRQQATASGQSELARAGDDDLRPIYKVVGGNPLAIRLVVGQHLIYTLDEILADLGEVKRDASQNLYRYIYKQAWANLGQVSRELMTSMLLTNPHGDSIDTLSAISGLIVDAIRKELSHLVQLNLIDARGGISERHYSIHSLTRSFLHTDVLDWIENDENSSGLDNG